VAEIAFAFPMKAGKADAFRKFLEEHEGPRGQGSHEARRNRGLRKLRVWRQHSPQEMVVVYLDVDDPQGAHEKLKSSSHEYDKWLLQMAEEVTGHRPDQLPGPPSDLVFEWDESGTQRHQAHKIR
jgi:hypothetical protein